MRLNYLIVLVISFILYSCQNKDNPLNPNQENKPPVVTVISPQNNSSLIDSVLININATDDKGITKLEIYIDNALKVTLLSGPYQFYWITSDLADSTVHSIYAKAYDADSNNTTSTLVFVTNYKLSASTLFTEPIINDTTAIKLTWVNNSNRITGYEIEMSSGTQNTYTKVASVAASVGVYNVQGLSPNIDYNFRVKATTSLGYSSFSNASKCRVFAAFMPPIMINVLGGTYAMGESFSDGDLDEQPVHSVTLNAFKMSATEINQKQWISILGSNPSYFTSSGDYAPVERVSWFDCISYCNKISILNNKTPCYSINGNTNPANWKTGIVVCDFSANGYRLPTEAEWEYAAKSGGQFIKFSGTSDTSEVKNFAWYAMNSNTTTHPTGVKQANSAGFYDMSGNVWEWCWDLYGSYQNTSQTNPTGSNTGDYRVTRGGSWDNSLFRCRSANRGINKPDLKSAGCGFRIVCK